MRTRKDALLRASLAVPADGDNNASAALDLGPGIEPARNFDALLSVAPLPDLADGKLVTVRLQDSVDGVAFADIERVAPFVFTGADGEGAEGISERFSLPPSTRQYVRFSTAADADAGDNTAVNVTLEFLF